MRHMLEAVSTSVPDLIFTHLLISYTEIQECKIPKYTHKPIDAYKETWINIHTLYKGCPRMNRTGLNGYSFIL